MSARGGKRAAPAGADRRRTFIAYLSCACCGHWWPIPEVVLRGLLDPAWFLCPLCAQGRKRACDDWDGRTRRLPNPPQLDIRRPPPEEAA